MHACTSVCTCVYVSACAHMEARRGHRFLPYHSSPIPLRQDLSLDLSLLLSQLCWKLASFSDLPLQSTSLGADVCIAAGCLACSVGAGSKQMIFTIAQQAIIPNIGSCLSHHSIAVRRHHDEGD